MAAEDHECAGKRLNLTKLREEVLEIGQRLEHETKFSRSCRRRIAFSQAALTTAYIVVLIGGPQGTGQAETLARGERESPV
jgi:hypothetical protein